MGYPIGILGKALGGELGFYECSGTLHPLTPVIAKAIAMTIVIVIAAAIAIVVLIAIVVAIDL